MTGNAAVSKPHVSSLFSADIVSCNPANDVTRNLVAELSESLRIAAFLFSHLVNTMATLISHFEAREHCGRKFDDQRVTALNVLMYTKIHAI